ncbi:MAG: UDP-2,3-diacylglucosamine diphosphatase LpxI [Roseovarius sp.]|nr:UDP-2,3-diacylglucosamine diphosphatase LpxI [Roseovarius sp.]
MRRPAVDPARIDAATAPLAPRLMAAMARGDDGTLREIVAIIEEAGIAVIGAAEIAPDLLPGAGLLTGAPPPGMEPAMAAAAEALAEMGRADEGQALVLRGGTVIAREDARGTDAMLDDLAQGDDWTLDPVDLADRALGSAADWLSGADTQGDTPAILVKAPKPGQEMRVDMPVIGPDTATRAARAGLAGIVIAAGGVMVLDRARVIEVLAGAGMFLWVRDMARAGGQG